MAARIFYQERNSPRSLSRNLGDFDRTDLFELIGGVAAGLVEGVEILQARAGADAGKRHGQHAIGCVERNLKR